MRRPLLASVLFLTTVACIRTATDVQRDYAKKFKPAGSTSSTMARSVRPEGPVRTLKLRVYADADYQAQTRNWQERILAQVARASAAVRPAFGVQFEVESIRHWERPNRSSTIRDAVAELETLDAAQDVDWVVGFISSLTVFTASADELGAAPLFGRHFVMRGMDSIGEVQAFERVFDRIPIEEREALYRARRLHKETTVFLHEWGHTLGAFHDRSYDYLMSPMYDDKQSLFAEATEKLISVGLKHRDQRTLDGRAAWAAAYKASLSQHPSADWHHGSREEALSMVEYALLGLAPSTGEARLLEADRLRFNEAITASNGGRHAEALKLVEPLIAKYAAHLDLQRFACATRHRVSPKEPQTLRQCQTAAALPGQVPAAALVLAHVTLETGDTPGAVSVLADTAKRMKADAREKQDWAYLAQLFLMAKSPSHAEAAATQIPGTAISAEVMERAQHLRVWHGLPRGTTAITADREHEYLDALIAFDEDLRAERLDRAQTRQKSLAETWADLPGAALANCELATQTRSVANVRKACGAALKVFPDATRAHFRMAYVALAERTPRMAMTSFARVIELDPTFPTPWTELARLYAEAGDQKPLMRLQEQYRARYGRELSAPAAQR